MRTESGVQEESQRGPAKRQGLKARDIVGIVMGALLLLFGVPSLAYNRHLLMEEPEFLSVAGVLLAVPFSLMIPSAQYENRTIRAIGFIALSLTSALSIVGALSFVAFLIITTQTEGEWALLPAAIAAAGLLLFVLFGSSTWVLLKKVRPRLAHLALGILGAFLAAGMYGLLVYLSHKF